MATPTDKNVPLDPRTPDTTTTNMAKIITTLEQIHDNLVHTACFKWNTRKEGDRYGR